MAKQRQEFLRARLNNLEARVAELSMINLDSMPRDTVGLGSKVELEDLDEGTRSNTRSWCPKKSTARSIGSRCLRRWARSLIGKACDDDIEVQTPKGKRAYMVRKLVHIHELLASENGNGEK